MFPGLSIPNDKFYVPAVVGNGHLDPGGFVADPEVFRPNRQSNVCPQRIVKDVRQRVRPVADSKCRHDVADAVISLWRLADQCDIGEFDRRPTVPQIFHVAHVDDACGAAFVDLDGGGGEFGYDGLPELVGGGINVKARAVARGAGGLVGARQGKSPQCFSVVHAQCFGVCVKRNFARQPRKVIVLCGCTTPNLQNSCHL